MKFFVNNDSEILRLALPGSFLISKIARFIAIFYLMSLLSPQHFADWITISLILQYSLYLQFGVPVSSSREVSISVGKKDREMEVLFSIMPIQFLFLATILLLIFLQAFYYQENLYLVFIYIFISHLSALLLTLARSKFKNGKVIFSNILDSFIVIIGMMLWSGSDPIQSILLTYIAAGFFVACICCPSLEITTKLFKFKEIDLFKFLDLIKISLPLLIFNLLILFRSSWDILLIKSFYSFDGATAYITSQVFIDSIRILTSLLAMFYIPYLAKIFGEDNEKISQHSFLELRNFKRVTFLIFILVAITFYPFLIFASGYFIEYSNMVDIYYFRTISVLLAIIALPNLLFFNTIRKPTLSLQILLFSFILPIPLIFILDSFLTLDKIFILILFISSLVTCLLSENFFRKLQNNNSIKGL